MSRQRRGHAVRGEPRANRRPDAHQLADTDIAAETVALTRSSRSRQMADGFVAQAQLTSGRVLSLLTGAT